MQDDKQDRLDQIEQLKENIKVFENKIQINQNLLIELKKQPSIENDRTGKILNDEILTCKEDIDNSKDEIKYLTDMNADEE